MSDHHLEKGFSLSSVHDSGIHSLVTECDLFNYFGYLGFDIKLLYYFSYLLLYWHYSVLENGTVSAL